VYADASTFKVQQALTGKPFAEGPYRDGWGSWISGYAPVFDTSVPTVNGRRTILAVVGMDISVRSWLLQIAYMSALPAIVTICIEVLLYFSYRAIRRQDRYIRVIDSDREKLRTVLENLPVGVLVLRASDGTTEMMNRAAVTIFGCHEADRKGRGSEMAEKCPLEHEDGKLMAHSKLPRVITLTKGKSVTVSDVFVRRSDGTRVNTRETSVPVRNAEGAMEAVIVVLEDITQDREVDRMKSEFVTLASHQLRTPLTGIKWFAELLLRGKAGALSNKEAEYVQQMHVCTDRMITLIDDLLDVSRIETGRKYFIEKKSTDVVKLLQDLFLSLHALAEQRREKLVLSKSFPKELELNIDGEKIGHVFQNLLTNALRYSKPGGEIRIGCRKDHPKFVVFSVQDFGLGIPAAQQNRVFERFFRGDNVQTAETNGTGLGLYIAKSIVEGHGGKMWFESVENEGSTFYFSLPAG
jgi:PAS domain S-box-containing protein